MLESDEHVMFCAILETSSPSLKDEEDVREGKTRPPHAEYT